MTQLTDFIGAQHAIYTGLPNNRGGQPVED